MFSGRYTYESRARVLAALAPHLSGPLLELALLLCL
jgi:hypothetical protein